MTKVTAGVAFVCTFIVLYMGKSFFQLIEETHQLIDKLSKVTTELELLRLQNIKLQENNNNSNNINKINNQNLERISTKAQTTSQYNIEVKQKNRLQTRLNLCQRQIEKLQVKIRKTNETKGFSNSFELLRRRVENYVKEMWFLSSAQIHKLQIIAPEIAKQELSNFSEDFRDLQQFTERDFERLINMEGAKEKRDNTAKELTLLIQNRLKKLQNPQNCDSARKLVCSLNKGCGYGCEMHHILYCFLVAYATKRTLILKTNGWRYSSKGWNHYFHPLSDTCLTYQGAHRWDKNHSENQVVHLPIFAAMKPRIKQMPLNVPSDIYDKIVSFHGQPFLWWVAQFARYIFNYQPKFQDIIEKTKKSLGFQRPIVGVQVRRTDKLREEAGFHAIEEYMYWVDMYYRKLELTQKIEKRRVFLATDDPSVLPEARKKYPDYIFVSNNDVSKSASVNRRFSDASLSGAITDIELLSESDYLVCTFSSNVCRLAFEMMNHKHTDASGYFHSLDDIYYFDGASAHKMKAISPYKSRGPDELNLAVGDIVGIYGNHWDGQAKALHFETGRAGLFPAYKIEDIHNVADFPSYEYEDAAKS